MKVLAVNGSPRPGGATARLLEALLAGMEDAGAATRHVRLGALDLQPCTGCFSCWTRTPGRCIHHDRDGLAGILDAWRGADLLVLGTPLYHFSMTGLMKTFLDRLLPESEPWLVADPGDPARTIHPRRHPRAAGQAALLVSPCGFPEAQHFDALVRTFRVIAEHHGWSWRGELLRPGAEPLARAGLAPLFAPYLADVRRAGAALVTEGAIPGALVEALARPLLPGEAGAFRERANRFWAEELAEARRRAAGERKASGGGGEGPVPTLRQQVEGMALGFDAEAAAGRSAVIEFQAPAERPPSCHLVVDARGCRFAPGPAERPTLRLRTDGATWREVSRGALDGAAAMASGRLAAEGDASVLLELRPWFRRIDRAALDAPRAGPPGRPRLPSLAWLAVAFVPWKALWIGLALDRPRAGALAGAALAAALLLHRHRAGAATFFEAASAVLLAAAAAVPLAHLAAPRLGAASLAAMGAIWALGAWLRPLGLSGEYARWSYPPAVTGTALFRHPNVLLSLVWAGAFLGAALLDLAPLPAGRGWLAALVQTGLFAAAAHFTARRRRAVADARIDDVDEALARLRRIGGGVAAAAAAVAGLALAL